MKKRGDTRLRISWPSEGRWFRGENSKDILEYQKFVIYYTARVPAPHLRNLLIEWMKICKNCISNLIALAHYGSGQPDRGTKLATFAPENTTIQRRSVYAYRGFINLVAMYNKTPACLKWSCNKKSALNMGLVFLCFNFLKNNWPPAVRFKSTIWFSL